MKMKEIELRAACVENLPSLVKKGIGPVSLLLYELTIPSGSVHCESLNSN